VRRERSCSGTSTIRAAGLRRPRRTRATTRCWPSSAPGRARPTWPRSATPTRSSVVAEAPLVAPGEDSGSVTDRVSAIVLRRSTPPGWLLGFALSATLLLGLLATIAQLLVRGVGIWGINVPV